MIYIRIALVTAACTVLASCNLFLRGRLDSEAVEGEKVVITLSRVRPQQTQVRSVGLPAIGSVAGVVVGLAVDFVQKQLEEEASAYEAQFSGSTSSTGNGIPGRLRVQRYVKGSETACFEFQADLVSLPLAKAADADPSTPTIFMMRLVPRSLRIDKTKAKILSDDAVWWLLPTAWYGKLFKTSGHHVGVEVSVTIEAVWWDAKRQQLVRQAMPYLVPPVSVDLDVRGASPTTRTASFEYPAEQGTEWQGVFPDAAVFNARVTVTERDPSNARKYLLAAAKVVGEERKRIVEEVTRVVGGQGH